LWLRLPLAPYVLAAPMGKAKTTPMLAWPVL